MQRQEQEVVEIPRSSMLGPTGMNFISEVYLQVLLPRGIRQCLFFLKVMLLTSEAQKPIQNGRHGRQAAEIGS